MPPLPLWVDPFEVPPLLDCAALDTVDPCAWPPCEAVLETVWPLPDVAAFETLEPWVWPPA